MIRLLTHPSYYVGHFLGFEVEHGRYQGTTNDIGHDGLRTIPTGFHVVIKTKTTEQFHIKTSALTGYVNKLISEQRISDWENAMGLYVIGDPDPEVKQLRNATVAENKTDKLRTISIDALLSLAELLSEYDVSHEDALAVLRPSGPSIDGEGVVADAIVDSEPEKKANPDNHLATPNAQHRTTHIFQLRNPTLYLEEPVFIDESLRGRLEAFEEHDLSKSWSVRAVEPGDK